MKIITLKRMTMDGAPIYVDPLNECSEDPNDWWAVIETKEEEALYEMAIGSRKPIRVSEENMPMDKLMNVWNDLVCFAGAPQGLAWGDDDVYGYIRPDETEPEIGEEWTDGDGDRWIRVE